MVTRLILIQDAFFFLLVFLCFRCPLRWYIHIYIYIYIYTLQNGVLTQLVVNKVILIGRVGADPQINEVGERRVANYTLATSEVHPDREGTVEK